MPGSHLKRCLEEFLSPPTTAPPPPLTEIPHLAWKADVLPKGKETGLGGLCSEKRLSCCGACCLLPGRDFWSRAVMTIHPSPLSAACFPGLPRAGKGGSGTRFWPARHKGMSVSWSLRAFSFLLQVTEVKRALLGAVPSLLLSSDFFSLLLTQT